MRRRSGGKGKSIEQARDERAGRVAGALLRCLRRNRTTDPRLVCEPWRRGDSPERVHGVQRSAIRGARRHTTGEATRPTGCPSHFGRTRRSSGPHSGRCRPKGRAICRRRSATSDIGARIRCLPEPTPTGAPQVPSRKRPCCRGFSSWSKGTPSRIWWYNRLRRPAVDLESADDPYVSGLSASLRRAAARPLGARRHERLRSTDLCGDIEAGGHRPKRTSSTVSARISTPASPWPGR